MKQLLQNYKTGELKVEEVPVPVLKPGGVLVKNHYSIVSAGTERAMLEFARQNLLSKARSRPDLVHEVLNKLRADGLSTTYRMAKQRLDLPVPLGYSSAGEVIEVGKNVESFQKGNLVACAGGGYACHAEVIFVPKNLVVKIPKGVSTQEAVFVTLGAIALQGIHRTELTVGQKVAVIGLGLIGQLTVQILRAYGFPVLGIDINPKKIEETKKRGMEMGGVVSRDDIEKIAQTFSNGVGVDAVIITAATKSSQPVELAGRILRERGRVSVVGNVGMQIPRDIYYHKELDFSISRSYGPGRYDSSYEEKGIDYPIAYARWTEKRNMGEFLRLIRMRRIDVKSMITHIFPIEEALKAYELILNNPHNEDFTGVLLKYSPEKKFEHKVVLSKSMTKQKKVAAINVGLVGGGNFAKAVILPNLKKIENIYLKAVATATGKSSADIAKKYNFEYATTDYRDILNDEEVNLVIIATRHNLHASITIEALKRGKNVHTEKPLALDIKELKEITKVSQDSRGRLMVGFNRRFSPLGIKIKEKFSKRDTPLMITYRVNAGYIPLDNWVQDPEEGGGRIIGEVCHFVDFLQFLTNSYPEYVYAAQVKAEEPVIGNDNIIVNIDFADGSRGSVLYTALGDKSLSKEYVEVFGGGKSVVINNFKTGLFNLNQDKGHFGEFKAFTEAILKGKSSPIPLEELILTTLTTFKIHQSLDERKPVKIDISEVIEE